MLEYFGEKMSLPCKINIHTWDGCKCLKCGKIKDEDHFWEDCKCSKCGKIKDENHSWDGCKCLKCGKVKDQSHSWDGCKCSKCGKIKDENHSWDGCKCSKCGKIKNENHSWEGCECSRCGILRNENHSWCNNGEGCKCIKCGKIRNKNHSWYEYEDEVVCKECQKKLQVECNYVFPFGCPECTSAKEITISGYRNLSSYGYGTGKEFVNFYHCGIKWSVSNNEWIQIFQDGSSMDYTVDTCPKCNKEKAYYSAVYSSGSKIKKCKNCISDAGKSDATESDDWVD